MKPFDLLFVLSVILVSCSKSKQGEDEVKVRSEATDQASVKKSRSIISDSQLIQLSIQDSSNQTSINDPNKLKLVKAWIFDYAFPPIDLNKVGSVIPRGVMTVFETVDISSRSYDIPLYSSTSRANPNDIHITDEAWNELIRIISQ